mgnify:CR=1 FL=1
MHQYVHKTPIIVLFLLLFSLDSRAERLELEESPSLKKMIQQKFEDIKELRLHQHRWERSVRGFRREHNFSVSLGVDSGTWLGQFPNSSSSVNYLSTQYQLRGRYSFHIPVWKRVGYFLGTSFGRSIVETSGTPGFESPGVSYLPGVSGGLVWNISPGLRVSVGSDLNLVRLQDFYHEDDSILTTGRRVSQKVLLDLFMTISTAISIEYEWYDLSLAGTNEAELRRSGESLAIGWLTHLI